MKIGVLLGDDIGLEVVPECVKVMKAAAARTGLVIDWSQLPIGKRGHEEHGHTLPPVTEAALRDLDGWIMGPIGHNAYPRGDATWVMPPVRKKFELFAAVRPALSHANVKSVHKDVDIVFVREITEGMLYSETVVAGAPEFRPNDDITVAMRVITRKGSNRVAREAFEIARTRPRKKVTAAHKEPVYRLACGMFAEECRKLAQRVSGRRIRRSPDRHHRDEARHGAAAVRRGGHDKPVWRHSHRHWRRSRRRTRPRAGLRRRREPGDGAGDPRLGARHRRAQHRQSLCHDHVRADAARLAWPQARRAESDGGGATRPRGRAESDRRCQTSNRRSRRQAPARRKWATPSPQPSHNIPDTARQA